MRRRDRRRRRAAARARPQPPGERCRPRLGEVGQHAVAEVRNHDHRDEPGDHERDCRHLEQRARVLAGRALRGRDRQEARDRDQRAGEHREGRRRVGEACRAEAVVALLQLDRHHLHRDDRVVDEQPERQDQRAERDLVQADAEHPHQQERRGEHQRDRHGDDEAGAQAQAHQRHREHDQHRLRQRAHELVDGALHRLGHARHRRELDADRHLLLHAADRAVELAAERDHVAAGDHRHAETHRLAPHPAHLLLRRVDVAALHLRDVAEPEDAVVGADRQVADRLQRVERAGRPQVDAVGRGLERARGLHRVLRGERLDDLRRLDAERRELAVRQLDEDLLFLLADEVHLGDAGHAQQLGADAVGEVLECPVVEAFAGDRVDVGVGVAELVVEERPLDSRRQLVADVADLLARLVLELRDLLRGERVAVGDEHQRLAGTAVAPHVLVRQLLQLALDAVGDLLLDVACRRARPVGLDDHDLERERRILRLPELRVGERAHHREQDDEVQHHRPVVQCPLGQVEPAESGAAGRRDGRHGWVVA